MGKVIQLEERTYQLLNLSPENIATADQRIWLLALRNERIYQKRVARIELENNEWLAIFDANNGAWLLDDAGGQLSHIWANVHDTLHLGEKWKIDQDALVRKLQQLDEIDGMVLAEAIYRFWSRGSDTTHDAMEETVWRYYTPGR